MANTEVILKNENAMMYYRLIGRLNEAVTRSDTVEQAIRNGGVILSEFCHIDYAITWFETPEDHTLRPYYWIGPMDFTSKSCRTDRGLAGRAFEGDKAVRALRYRSGDDPDLDEVFAGTSVSSVVCVPFAGTAGNLGCVEFVNAAEPFTDEDADVFEIFTLMLTMIIRSEDRPSAPAAHGELLLEARNITKEFQNGDSVTRVLKGMNLDIYKGEFLVILGESGCGKSTFLNIIGGMDRATGGTFTFEGKEYANATEEELTEYRRANIGFIFQSYNLMPNLNARQNIELISELVGDPMNAEEVLGMVGLEDKQKNYPSELSGGQQQRVSIARALVKRPKLIFADEPTAALDYATSIEVLTVMEEILRTGTSLVMVTHNEEITKMADRVVRIRDGRTYEVTVNRAPLHAADLVW